MGERATLVVLAAPALVLAAGSLLRSVPGEWSQSALLAWAAVSLAYLAGQAGLPAPLAVGGLALAFAGLALGGGWGLALLGASAAAAAVAGLAGALAAPWPPLALLAASCALGCARPLIH